MVEKNNLAGADIDMAAIKESRPLSVTLLGSQLVLQQESQEIHSYAKQYDTRYRSTTNGGMTNMERRAWMRWAGRSTFKLKGGNVAASEWEAECEIGRGRLIKSWRFAKECV